MNYSILIHRSADGEWQAHCLELDLLVQARTVSRATELIGERIERVVRSRQRSKQA